MVGVVGPTFNILKQIQLPVRYTDCGSWLWFEFIKILQNILPFLEPILFTMSTSPKENFLPLAAGQQLSDSP